MYNSRWIDFVNYASSFGATRLFSEGNNGLVPDGMVNGLISVRYTWEVCPKCNKYNKKENRVYGVNDHKYVWLDDPKKWFSFLFEGE